MIYHFLRRAALVERPKHIPEDALVFNAPRPLHGTMVEDKPVVWQGDFLSGVFYAAVLKDDEWKIAWLDYNRDMKAVLVWYVTEEEAKALVKEHMIEYVSKHTKNLAHVNVDEFVQKHWYEQFFNNFASRPVALDSDTFEIHDLLNQKDDDR